MFTFPKPQLNQAKSTTYWTIQTKPSQDNRSCSWKPNFKQNQNKIDKFCLIHENWIQHKQTYKKMFTDTKPQLNKTKLTTHWTFQRKPSQNQ